MDPRVRRAFIEEMDKIANAMTHIPKPPGMGAPAALSMGGLAGLTAIEGAGAFNKKKEKKERLKDAASSGFTGSILASEMLHNKDHLKKLFTKHAGPLNQAAMAKAIRSQGVRPGQAARLGFSAASHGPTSAAVARPMPMQHSSYADFMPAGKFTPAGQGLPQEQMRARSQTMAKQVAPVARPVFQGR